MKYILDENGNELKRLSFQRICELISKNITIFLAAIPLMGVAFSAVINFLIYINVKGRASYFNIPDEYLIINYKVTVYSVIIYGGFALLYAGVAIWTVRTILRQQSLGKRIFAIIFWGVILPMLFLTIVSIFLLDTPGQVFTLSGEDWREFLIVSIVTIVFLHGPFVYAMGYLGAYSIQKDLVRPKGEKKKVKTTQSYRWRNRDYKILGAIICLMGIVGLGWYYYYRGIQSVENQKDFQITFIDNNAYVVVMMDGNEAIVEKCDIEDNDTLKVNTNEYMKVECKNLLLQEKHFVNGVVK